MTQPLIIAHRGACAVAPENTLPAFEEALHQGCDGIELDVQLSKDGQLVVCHDKSIQRTTTGFGLIKDLTVRQMQQWDAGSWFDPRYANARIPLLEEVLSWAPHHLLINIEIKHASLYPKIEKHVARLLARFDHLHHVVVSSFDHSFIDRLLAFDDSVNAGLLFGSQLRWQNKYFWQAQIRKTSSIHPHYKRITKKNIARLRAGGQAVYPYTVNRKEVAHILFDAGVSGIITDFPAEMKQLLLSVYPAY